MEPQALSQGQTVNCCTAVGGVYIYILDKGACLSIDGVMTYKLPKVLGQERERKSLLRGCLLARTYACKLLLTIISEELQMISSFAPTRGMCDAFPLCS